MRPSTVKQFLARARVQQHTVALFSVVVLIAAFALLQSSITFAQAVDWVASGNHLYFTGGNVGIGTTSPGKTLDVAGDIRVGDTDSIGWWNAEFPGGGPAYYAARIVKSASSYAGNLQFYTRYGGDNSETLVMELSSPQTGVGQAVINGNVGIGTQSPTAKLHVAGETRIGLPSEPSTYYLGITPVDMGTAHVDYRLHSMNYPGVEKDLLYFDAISGNVGVGTTNPQAGLHVAAPEKANVAPGAGVTISGGAGGNTNIELRQDAAGGVTYLDFANDPNTDDYDIRLIQTGDDQFAIVGGNVGIGTLNPQSALAVNGTINAKEIIVTDSGWADFVFADDYVLMPLDELAAFIEQHNHLPNVPTEQEVLESGVSLGESQAVLLQKIEELTLYMLELKQENETLKMRLDILENNGRQ